MNRALIIPLLLLASLLGCQVFWSTAEAPKSGHVQMREMLPGEPSAGDMARARAMLETWENKEEEKGVRMMRIVYWTPADREPQPEFRARLTRVMRHIQDFYEREMAAWGFSGRTIRLHLEKDDLLHIPVARGKLKSAECSEQDGADGQAIRRDCLQALQEEGIDGDKETMVIFCNLAEWDAKKRRMSHHSPYYASGSSKSGTAWQVDSPLLDADFLSVKDQHLSDGQYGLISLGRYNSIFIGGVCHELGHALGLPHCKECPAAREARGTALMGSGNRTYGEELRGEGKGSFLTLPHALKLAAHPQFSGSIKKMNEPVQAALSEWRMESVADGLKVSAKVAANLPVHAILAYADPEGGGDYDSEIAAAIPVEGGAFSLLLPTPEKSKSPANLHFVAVAVNGAATASVWSAQALTMSCRIDDQSRYDIAQTLLELEVAAFHSQGALRRLNDEEASKLSPVAREIFHRLQRPDSAEGKPTPAAAAESLTELPLSDAAPSVAQTGWGGVHYDRTSEGMPLIGPGGPLRHGLYAHADSTYEYDLGGKWDGFEGKACILQKGYGPVEASIEGDGKVLWSKKPVKAGETNGTEFRIDVKGVQKLKLIFKGVDGNAGAWSAWGEGRLTRAGK